MGKFKKITTLKDLEVGKISSFDTKYVRLGLLKNENEIIAFEDICTHDGEKISSGKLENNTITCPRHFAKFNLLTGKALCMPATDDLQKFQVRITGEDVEVELED